MNVFEAIRENGITARQAAEHCGIKINRNGMAVCPFHQGQKPKHEDRQAVLLFRMWGKGGCH